MNDPTNRRDFLRLSGSVGLGLAALGATARAQDPAPEHETVEPPAAPAPERVVVGVMGMGGRGTELATEFAPRPGCVVSHVCDVDEGRVNGAAGAVASRRPDGPAPQAVGDFR